MLQPQQAYELVSERVEARQIETHLRVTVLPAMDESTVEGELVSLSPDQMVVQCPVTPAQGATVYLHFRMLSRRTCEARGVVVWRRNEHFGVAFEQCNEGMENFFNELAKLTPNLRQIYLADVLYPRIEVDG